MVLLILVMVVFVVMKLQCMCIDQYSATGVDIHLTYNRVGYFINIPLCSYIGWFLSTSI